MPGIAVPDVAGRRSGRRHLQHGRTERDEALLGSDDIDADIAKVKELGGEAEDKQPIPSVGWFAGCKDSEGQRVRLFQGDESAQARGT
jgi:predicted enzyme related to lactoylglutathione lyase